MLERIPDIMTLKECQKLLKVGRNTMLELIHNESIDVFKIGNRWKITKSAVIEYLKGL